MSAILGVVSFDRRPEQESVPQRMLSAMRVRGAEHVEIWRENGVTLAVSRYAWETGAGFSGPRLIVDDGEHVVAADASVYYLDDLRRRLSAAGIPVAGLAPAELIVAAYRAWGTDCARRIDGDFAFILWDRRRETLVCARDHAGMRPLHYAELPGTLILASTLGGVVAHPRCPQELDLANVGLDAAGIIFAYANETCYRAVRALPAGATVVRNRSGGMRQEVWWDPDVPGEPRSFPAAAEELRAILGDASEQRLDAAAPTAIWLSGGWDSSAVFAVANQRLATRDELLRPVSMSYPPGDSGREDERIQAIADHWDAPVRWVDSSGVPEIDISLEAGGARDEPFAFTFGPWMRHLARMTRPTGARTVLTGHGGNFLFSSSPLYLADLLASGRWRTLRREWRAMGVRRGRARHLARWAVQPLLPPAVLAAVEKALGRRILGTYERPLPAWLAPEFVARHGLAERARAAAPLASRGSRSAYELRWFMTHPLFPRINALAFQATLGEGIEQRAPIYDPRVIRFAAEGPWSERFSMGGGKRLLREAMRGLLPEEVLAARRGRTGTLATYVDRSMESMLPFLYRLLERPIVADLGIVEPGALKRDLDRCAAGRGYLYLPEQILSVAEVETWFRAREGVDAPRPPAPPAPTEPEHGHPAALAGVAPGTPGIPHAGG